MKLMKRSGIYQASNYNCTFNPKTVQAHSYKWWLFVAKIEGKVIFNSYRYSVTTAKHQSKVRALLNELGIKIDIELPLPNGIMPLDTLEEIFLTSEEHLCNQFLADQLKKQANYQRTKQRKAKAKLSAYLETVVNFRDYDIKSRDQFGTINEIAVHQIVDDIEHDVNNALYNFNRDGFGKVVFYV